MIEYRFFHWGPFVTQMKVPSDVIKKLLKHCKKKKKLKANKDLAGIIKEEYRYDNKIFMEYLGEYVKSYIKAVCKHYNLPYLEKGLEIKIVSSWVNYMKRFEYNPPHVHTDTLSCVLFLDVPPEIKKENENFEGTSGGPGCLEFRYGESLGEFFTVYQSIVPQTGDLFIFPARLQHSVIPFYSDVERISMSANFFVKESDPR